MENAQAGERMLAETGSVNWRDGDQPRQVELYGTDWTNGQLASVMDPWHWLGDVESLAQGFTVRLKRPMRATMYHSTRPGGDDLYLVWPADEPEPR